MDREPAELAAILEESLEEGRTDDIRQLVAQVDRADVAAALLRMAPEQQARFLETVGPQLAAQLIQQLPDHAAADLLSRLPIELAADVLDELPSDDQADLIGRLTAELEERILRAMEPEDAEQARRLLNFPPDSAGGLMSTEFLAYPEYCTVDDVVRDIREHAEDYARYDVQYVYVVDRKGRLVGVLRLRDILLSPGRIPIRDLMIPDPTRVHTHATIRELQELFRSRPFYGVPVVDDEGHLLGVVRRSDVEEAAEEEAGRTFLRFFGIPTGEELRTDPLKKRIVGRAAWLSTNLILDILAASIIAHYEDVLSAFIALAVFLPIVSDMGGNSGTQSVAVTIRELALGLVSPRDYWFILRREIPVGILTGVYLAALGYAVGIAWQGDSLLALVFAIALLANTIWSMIIGSTLPLLMARIGLDPALVSSPVLTTLTDMFGFFVSLECAKHILMT